MEVYKTNEKKYAEAKVKVEKIKMFYIHLLGYIVGASLIIWNFIIIEESQYAGAILAINWSSLIIWGIVIIIHAWVTFKGRILFSKSWEDRKVKEFIKEEEVEMWE